MKSMFLFLLLTFLSFEASALAKGACAFDLTVMMGKKEYVSTADLKKYVPQSSHYGEFIKDVESFEKDGGKGAWAAGLNPFRSGDKELLFYRILELPSGAHPKELVYWLRIPETVEFANKIVNSGTPFFLAKIPEGAGADAFVLPGDQEPATRLVMIDKSKHHNILVVQPEADRFILAHEFQHWTDYENPDFDKKLREIQAVMIDAKVSAEDIDNTMTAVIEWRGHAAQEKAALEIEKEKLPEENRAGTVIEHPNKDQYLFEDAEGPSLYAQAYWGGFSSAIKHLEKADPKGYARVYEIIKSLDLSPGRLAFDHFQFTKPKPQKSPARN